MLVSCKVTAIGLPSPTPSYLNIDKGMRLILDPKSQSACHCIYCR